VSTGAGARRNVAEVLREHGGTAARRFDECVVVTKATRAAGAVRSVENGPKTRSTL